MKKTSKAVLICLFCPVLAAIGGTNAAENNVRLGKDIFARATCESCHPGGGNSLHPSKPLKSNGFAKKYKDDSAIVAVVRAGVPKAGMPAFSKLQLSDYDLKLVIAYIRSLDNQHKVTNPKRP